MKVETEKVYCLFCETHGEAKVEALLKASGLHVITSLTERMVFKKGKIKKVLRPVIPGYVFFSSPDEPDWRLIGSLEHVYQPLAYHDSCRELRGDDLHFVQWLIRHNGIIAISKVIQVGKKIKVLEGPLKEYEGRIVKVRSRQKCCAVQIETEGLNNIIWLSYDVVEVREGS